ncbi:GNAT family N-acetyltransferase [Ferrimonas balearica]|uniref:GNAT family N-acetyltransferase n=1 Tax=Ferrimonas balearica TaxID=44012 RepID=UPI001C9985C9|nr:GNAT family N-acetyltransferase [Ferrimonas balearica]MBY5920779.1 GNAT family N-acetyltransferase [Ferrimonas balearica]MBY5996536.1 GNAT family N-acetyltransferase [Ferrimonas balearica]
MYNTARLLLRPAQLSDADFILSLVNSEGWLKHIGDRGIRTLKQAQSYIEEQLQAHYSQHGYGLFVMCLKPENRPVGLCGVLNRDTLPHPDLGFALLPQWQRQGLTLEACLRVLEEARDSWSIATLWGITSPDNAASAALLRRLGFIENGTAQLSEDADSVRRFVLSPVS